MGKFVTFKDKTGEYRFKLKAANGEVILLSEGYKSNRARENGIRSVRMNCENDSSYEKRTSTQGKPYFILKAKNGQIIGISEMYNSDSARESGILSVKRNGTSEIEVEQ